MMQDVKPLNQIEKNDLLLEQIGRKPFWEKTYRLGKERVGTVYEVQLRAFKLMGNPEGQEIRLEKRGLLGGRPIETKGIHLTKADLRGILAMFEEKEEDKNGI